MSIEGLSKDLLKSVAGVITTSVQKDAELSKANSIKLAEKTNVQSMRPRDTYEAKVAAEETRAPLRRLADAASAVFASTVAEQTKVAASEKEAMDRAYAKMGAVKPVTEGKEHTVPKTDKEKKLAALAEPKDKITHADVIKGRLTKEEQDFIDSLNSVDEAAIDDLKDKLAAKKEADADELKFKNDDKPASVKRTVKGKQYNGEKEKQDVEEAIRVVDTETRTDMKYNLKKGTPGSKADRKDAADTVKYYKQKKNLDSLYKDTSFDLTKEEVEALDEREDSPTKGTRKVASYGDDKHRAEVRYNPEYQEYQVHHYKDGKHQGEGPVSYHGDDKEDAHGTAKHSVGIKEEVEQVDEISKATLGSYVTKASKNASMIALGQMDAEHKAKKAKSPAMKAAWTKVRGDNQKRRWKREDNINKAVAKLTKEEEDRVAEIFNTLSKD